MLARPQIPNFNYYNGESWSFSMWVASDVCDPTDPTPSIFGYIYSHNQQAGTQAVNQNILQGDNQNINVYQSCSNGGYVRFVFVASEGFGSFDINLAAIDDNLDDHAAFVQVPPAAALASHNVML